ncbi:MAG: hypothetical protein Q8R39_01975, partial [bacterium]|nr:hypothetical protein [bacterium]MDZ4284735.1 hypothetical protein [Patescibacteria group bacterium]
HALMRLVLNREILIVSRYVSDSLIPRQAASGHALSTILGELIYARGLVRRVTRSTPDEIHREPLSCYADSNEKPSVVI